MPIGVGNSFWRRISHSILSLCLTDSPSMSKVSGARLPREALLCWLMQKQHIQAYLRLDWQKNLTLVGSAERWFATRLRSLWVGIIFFAVLQQGIHDVAHPHKKKSENLSYSMIFYLVHLQEMRVEWLCPLYRTYINQFERQTLRIFMVHQGRNVLWRLTSYFTKFLVAPCVAQHEGCIGCLAGTFRMASKVFNTWDAPSLSRV